MSQPIPTATPAGWYLDRSLGQQRWWDGETWTARTRPAPARYELFHNSNPQSLRVLTVVVFGVAALTGYILVQSLIGHHGFAGLIVNSILFLIFLAIAGLGASMALSLRGIARRGATA